MRISDWSSDVCSSDLDAVLDARIHGQLVAAQRVIAIGLMRCTAHFMKIARAAVVVKDDLLVELAQTVVLFIHPGRLQTVSVPCAPRRPALRCRRSCCTGRTRRARCPG